MQQPLLTRIFSGRYWTRTNDLCCVLFSDRFDNWFTTTVNLRPSTRARDESYARSLILPTFGSRPLSTIDHDAVQGWTADLIARGKAPSTVAKAHQILSKVLPSAVKARLIARNRCDDTELPVIEREEQRFLTPTEAPKLANEAAGDARLLVLVAAYSGLRIGELFGLRVGRVDTMRSSLEVAEIAVEVKGKLHFGPPKTKAGRRTALLPHGINEQLTQHIAG